MDPSTTTRSSIMGFGFLLKRKKQRSPFWSALMFRELKSQPPSEDSKVFHTHHGHSNHSRKRKGLSALFDSLAPPQSHTERITISSSNKPLQTIEVNEEKKLLIGSHPMSEILLEGKDISRFHALLTRRDGRLWVRDFHSRTGVLVNGQRIPPNTLVELSQKSVMQIGSHRLRFEGFTSSGPPGRVQARERLPLDPADLLLSSGLIHHPERVQVWSSITTELSVTGIIQETEDVKTFRLTGRRPLLFRYEPGQFIKVITAIAGREVRRSYSLASSPSRPNTLEITVKRLPGGLMSNWLCDHLQVGDKLRVRGPHGHFSCFNHPGRRLLFIAAGSGVVPIMSMLRWIVDTDAGVDVKLLLSFRRPADIIYRRELALFAGRYDNIDLHWTITGAAPEWQGRRGRIDGTFLQQTVPDLPQRQIFLCGPEPFMQTLTADLKNEGARKENIHVEHFFDQTRKVERRHVRERIRNNEGKHQVSFARSGLNVRCDETISLLDLALAYDIPVDNDCRDGSCGQCMVKCLKGLIELSDKAEIDPTTRQAGWIYSCCARAKSDVVLDL